MNKRTFASVLTAISFLGVLNEKAFAVPVTISGYVADLTGIPHDRPNITIRIRAVKANREIATGVAKADGSFSIPIDPDLVPDEDVTLSITADGTAFINGTETAVRTVGTLTGLAGEIDSKFATQIPNSTARVIHFIVLIVPKANECIVVNCEPRCYPRRFLRCRR